MDKKGKMSEKELRKYTRGYAEYIFRGILKEPGHLSVYIRHKEDLDVYLEEEELKPC